MSGSLASHIAGRARARGARCSCAPAAPAGAQAVDPRGVDPASPNPLAGQRWFVDLDRQPSARSFRTLRRKGEQHAASLMWQVAREPKFQWFGRWNHSSRAIRQFLERAERQQPGAIPLVTIMRHQGKGCRNRYDGGGAREDKRTRRWYRGFARGGGRAARGDRLRARLARHDRLPRPRSRRFAPHAPAALRRRRALAAAERDDLPRGRRLGLGAGQAHRLAAALDRDRQGARLHAQRHPLRLDRATTSSTASRSRA